MTNITDNTTGNTGVIWITGFSASGKTTVGRKLKHLLEEKGVATIFLDGDDMRSIFGRRWGYDRAERIELAKVYFRMCSHLASQGFTVIIAAVAMYEEIHEWFKQNVPNAMNAYLDVPEDVRRERDLKTKNIYKEQDFTKIYDILKHPDLVVPNFPPLLPENAAQTISKHFLDQKTNREPDRGKKKYWDTYYSCDSAPQESSPFAKYVSETISGNLSILEVGCGNGRDASFFKKMGHDVTAIDASMEAIHFCTEIYSNSGIEFTHGTADEIPEKLGQKFDVIYSRFCLHAMTPTEEATFLQALPKLINKSGKILIECRSINDPMARQGEVISLTERIHGHYRRFIILEELLENLQNNGLQVIDSMESNGLAKFGDEDPVVIRVTATPK